MVSLRFFSNLLGKVIHTFNIFEIAFQRVSPGLFRLFRVLVKIAIDNLEYEAQKELYDRMQKFADSTSNRWDNIFVDMIKTRFPLGKLENQVSLKTSKRDPETGRFVNSKQGK